MGKWDWGGKYQIMTRGWKNVLPRSRWKSNHTIPLWPLLWHDECFRFCQSILPLYRPVCFRFLLRINCDKGRLQLSQRIWKRQYLSTCFEALVAFIICQYNNISKSEFTVLSWEEIMRRLTVNRSMLTEQQQQHACNRLKIFIRRIRRAVIFRT